MLHLQHNFSSDNALQKNEIHTLLLVDFFGIRDAPLLPVREFHKKGAFSVL